MANFSENLVTIASIFPLSMALHDSSYAGPYLPITLCLNMFLHQVKQMFGLADTSISREGNRHDMNYTELDFKILGLK